MGAVSHVQVVDAHGAFVGPDQTVRTPSCGDIAALAGGALVSVSAGRPGYAGALRSSPRSRQVTLVRLPVA